MSRSRLLERFRTRIPRMNEFLKGAFALCAHLCNSRLRIPIFEKAIAMPVSPAVELLENMLLDHPVASEISDCLVAKKFFTLPESHRQKVCSC